MNKNICLKCNKPIKRQRCDNIHGTKRIKEQMTYCLKCYKFNYKDKQYKIMLDAILEENKKYDLNFLL